MNLNQQAPVLYQPNNAPTRRVESITIKTYVDTVGHTIKIWEYGCVLDYRTFDQHHDLPGTFQLVHHVLQGCGSDDVGALCLIVQEVLDLEGGVD